MKVQELLSSREKWTQRAPARNIQGNPVGPDSPDAVKWCLVGAIVKCYPLEQIKIARRIEDTINESIGRFNDRHTYEEVMKLVRELDI